MASAWYRRGMRKRERVVAFNLRMTSAEHAVFVAAADRDGRSLSDWARRSLMKEAAAVGVTTERKARAT